MIQTIPRASGVNVSRDLLVSGIFIGFENFQISFGRDDAIGLTLNCRVQKPLTLLGNTRQHVRHTEVLGVYMYISSSGSMEFYL